MKSWLGALVVLLPGGAVLLALAWLVTRRPRCAAALWLLPHDTMMLLRRDHRDRPTGVVDWECQRCGRIVGTTALGANRGLLTALRRQFAAARQRARRAA